MSNNPLFPFLQKVSFKRHPEAFLLFFLFSFFLILSFFNRFFFTPKILTICFLILVAGILGKLKIFLKGWFIFISFLYLFDSLRGTIYILTCKLNLPVYALYAIKIEKKLFSNIPSVSLQNIFLKGTTSSDFTWFEKFLTVLHGTHFIAFLFVGLIIWIHKSDYFRSYKTSFYLVASIGIAGYFIVPTVPPWMASQTFHIIPELTRFNILIYNVIIPTIKTGFDTNPIAAMPSLHAAFPILCSIILWHTYRWKALFFFIYTFFVLFVIVYSGDHYVVDIIVGGILSILCYFLAFKVKLAFSKAKKGRFLPLKQIQNNFIKENEYLIIGIPILILGISIGLTNKNQFENKPSLYTYASIPRYIDFFNNKENYAQNYHVQYYFGNYYLEKEKIATALLHFERALSVSKTIVEKKWAQLKIEQCKILIKKAENKKSS